METPSFVEDHISQIPAIQWLCKLGFEYLTESEELQMRGNKTQQVILEEILRKQLRLINSEKKVSSSRTTYISDANIENGIRSLQEIQLNEGYIHGCEAVYNLLTLGMAVEQSVDGDRKSFTLHFIDWDNPENNKFHVTEEYRVMRSTSRDHYVPDLVLFINGIPIVIIECKRPDMKDPLRQAISQHLRNQQEDGIRSLYVYSQILLSLASQEASYATNGTPEKFWAKWKEKFTSEKDERNYRDELIHIKNSRLGPALNKKLFGERFRYVQEYFEALEGEEIQVTEQDEYLYNLCHPERLMDLIYSFVLFDDGAKKITRYQQYFAVKKTLDRIKYPEKDEKGRLRRKGGVIWHTQGSGKSLTMVMLAQAIAMETSISNPKVILVTDRTDLDRQITNTFRKCGMEVSNAATGSQLVHLLESPSDAVVTTIINKFAAAVKKIQQPLDNHNIFVLIDEGHRTQHGTFNVEMQKALPNACFIAMTGTPLFKKDKSTAAKFGGMIDAYTVDQAVDDGAVVPLLYEGRLPRLDVNSGPLDKYFEMVSEPFSEKEKADFKKKFSRADQINSAEQRIYSICWDVSLHFRDNWKGTGFKAMLVCDKKVNAIKFKEVLDEIGLLSSEVLISPVDDREGEDSAYEQSSDKVQKFWKRMIQEHGTPKKYETQIINRYKNQPDPEIIIVVDKLLTGFDEPKTTVLYLTRNLQDHKLLQAIARVNRVYPDKDFGYVIDYYGVIENLDDAFKMYSAFQAFEEEDVEGTLVNISEEIKKLPQKYSELWDLFKGVGNTRDAEAYQQVLRDEAIRASFYDKLNSFAKSLKLALSTISFHEETEQSQIERYKSDLLFFVKLRNAVSSRYSDRIDYSRYESQIQKLIDTHVTAEEVEPITELVNIFDQESFAAEVEKTVGEAAKADKIASRTAKHIAENMEDDPAFYKKFSQMLSQAIADYESRRISETQYLQKVKDLMNGVLNHTDTDLPDSLREKPVAAAFFGLTSEFLNEKISDQKVGKLISEQASHSIDQMVKTAVFGSGPKAIVDWENKDAITGKLIIEIGDYLIDEVRDKYQLELSFSELDELAVKILEVAKRRYKS
ncbi:type I restriction enzyme, R subunit [Algoriphagus faecimaris]|uniref:Type I restriction enzyme endonuclease subunit n=2 Tax=Algoriphagus TaxID=246875 RepID=A0A1G6NBX7_9BACT|nr:HsdR family type I site-specific deoxyribonuclease [Algoriphagus faecimaris]SDC65288.1 type I restriction enzyme, R subunit [Algoriphagus faecimaris]